MAFIPVYILILAITIIIDYFAGIFIEKNSGPRRKFYLIISVISTCLVLFVFKYFNFFNTNLAAVADVLRLHYPVEYMNIILPIGLSFHTFQSLSYVVEVYRGKQKAEHHFGIYALYVMFYPQLVAGPIERPQNLLHQFREEHHFDYSRVTDGLKIMAWGMFKKVVIADRLALFVNQVYDSPHNYQGLPLIIATVFFAFQIYCDFSGYSDIAIGSARVMGFKLMSNFNRPYLSKSITEFWKRWHISLSTWFRDYLYIPLGGSRVPVSRRYFNLFITFLISGLWHGASWTFVAWGGLNGLYLIFGIITRDVRARFIKNIGLNKIPFLRKTIQIFITFALTCMAWVFFRAQNIDDAFYIIINSFSGIFNFSGESSASLKLLYNGNIITSAMFIVLLLIIEFTQRHGSIREQLLKKPIVIRWAFYYMVIFTILFFSSGAKEQFIYFQF